MFKLGKNFLSFHSKRCLYFAQVQSHLVYGLSVWGNMSTSTALSRLQKLPNKSIALINSRSSDNNNYRRLNILRINQLLELENCKFGYKLLHNELPVHIHELSYHDQLGKTLIKGHKYNTRNKKLLNKLLVKNKHYRNCIIYKGTGSLEPLKAETKLKPNLSSFVHACKKAILNFTT